MRGRERETDERENSVLFAWPVMIRFSYAHFSTTKQPTSVRITKEDGLRALSLRTPTNIITGNGESQSSQFGLYCVFSVGFDSTCCELVDHVDDGADADSDGSWGGDGGGERLLRRSETCE